MSQVLPSYWVEVVTTFGIFSLTSLGLYVCFIAKQYSLTHAALMGVGAYTAALVSVHFPDLPLALGLALGVLGGGLTGVVVAVILALRLSEFYLAIGTLAFNLALQVVVINIPALGGPNGIVGVSLDATAELTLGLLVICIALVVLLERSRLGRAMRAIHEDEAMAAVNGVRVWAVKLAAFGIGGALAGLAGGLQVHDLGLARPEIYDSVHSTILWVPLVVGGSASVLGPVLGSAIYVLLPELINQRLNIDVYWILGSLLIVSALFRPSGLIGTGEVVWMRATMRSLSARLGPRAAR